MRTVNFRDGVLHAVAYKLGLDPDQSNFLTNQAIPIGTYIDEWVRRVYGGRDWPEWTLTKQFVPSSHVVPWDAIPADGTLIPVQIGRVLKVYLVDPATTDAPVDTPFEILDDGIHVGYEHGTYVWIRYIAPAPKFTAIQWMVANTYQLGDVVYSYTTGECYKSKVNANVGHDPAVEGDLTPTPPIINTTQPWTPDNSGIAERAETMVVNFTEFTGVAGTPPPDPPLNGSVYKMTILDADGVSVIGSSFVTADGVMTIDDIIDASVTLLVGSLPGTFVVTGSHTDKTVSMSNNSVFSATGAQFLDTDTVARNFLVVIQAYIPPVAAVDGVPQITRVTMSVATTFPMATYTLTVTDSVGAQHTVSYASAITDGAAQILQGLVFAVEASSDTYFQGVQLVFDPSLLTLDASIRDNASVNVVTVVTGSAYWDVVPFPKALADQVIRGAYADLLKEWGQSDKGAMEEQAVPSETATSEANFDTTPNPPLTGQQRSLSRYKV